MKFMQINPYPIQYHTRFASLLDNTHLRICIIILVIDCKLPSVCEVGSSICKAVSLIGEV